MPPQSQHSFEHLTALEYIVAYCSLTFALRFWLLESYSCSGNKLIPIHTIGQPFPPNNSRSLEKKNIFEKGTLCVAQACLELSEVCLLLPLQPWN